MTDEKKDFDTMAVAELFGILPPLHEMFNRRIERCGEGYFTQLQLRAMMLLVDKGPLAMNEISRNLRMSKQQLTRFIDTLVKRGFLERFHRENNRRTIYIRVTELGRREVESYRSQSVDEQAGILRNFGTDREAEELYLAARRVHELVEKIWSTRAHEEL